MRLQGKVAVITGAASGMGLAMATRFAEEGASIVAADWNAQRLDEAVAHIQANGGTIIGVQGNIADQATAEGLIERAISEYGRLDVLCNNAGVMDYMQGVGELSDDVWRRVLGINLDGPMFATRKAVQYMLAHGGGSIVNTASTAAIHGGAAGVAYTTSKHALVGLTRNTAWMYAKQGIRCNAICPGATITNIAESMPQERLDPAGAQRAQTFAALAPAYLEPADIASLALFLASDESRHINGAIIPADGGWAAV
ncbi:MAG TPA: glucose 1-dehydrogenase [Ktedonobacterales bacterium]|jgi:NAD(P)-dependent dehydrogenase (short-subunit alcohol dehydrogenase family)|nr:glucose 1-dehydrogenase [Ktedonobacterales bacterium]